MDNVSSALAPGHLVDSSFDNQVKGLIRAGEAKIACLESQIRDLQRLRDQERELVTALKPLIAPIRKLPSELLLEAFQMTIDSVSWDLSWLEQVLAISGVCVRWRKLVCTTPQFWERRLEFNLTKAFPDSYLSTAKTFLERSTPLAIPISLGNNVSETSPLARYIFSIASRWKSLSLYHSQIDSLLRELPNDALQCLESVGIWSYRDEDSLSPLPITVFLGARRLRSVTIHGTNIHHFPMPWSQLTDLTLIDSSESAQNCLDVLAQCANVVTAYLTGLLPWATPAAPVASAQIIKLVHLKTLEVGLDRSDEIHFTPFFARLAVPALTHLSIGTWSNTIWSSSDFTPFQRRSPKIEQLEISGPRLTSENFTSLLLESPSLTNLSLSQCFQDAAAIHSVLSCLQYSDTQTVHLVPRLQQLHISCSEFRLDEPILERTILSRWWADAHLLQLPVPPPVARWKRLEIYTGLEDDAEVYSESFQAKMAQAQEEGLWLALDTMNLPPT